MLRLCIFHTSVHLIIDFFLYKANNLHAKGDNVENWGVLLFEHDLALHMKHNYSFVKLYYMANICLRQRLGINNLSRGVGMPEAKVL